MDIYSKITEAQGAFYKNTGKRPKHCYIGRMEMRMLMEWAEKNSYIHNFETTIKEGSQRPEVNGLYVFEVNADSHLVCA